mmetsp:Transcript_12294/g.34969  ORF Transcript_12294/g.34969 Transcript_12294/m.34969 type:complete len:329 (-) Transcript_12294:103-1089(-)
MVHDVRTNIMVNLVEDAVVPVDRREPSPHVVPLLSPVPGHLLLRIRRPMVMQICHHVQPDNKHPVRDEVQVEHGHRPQRKRASRQETDEPDLEGVRRPDHVCLSVRKQIRLRVVVRPDLARRPVQEIKRVGKQREREQQTTQPRHLVHTLQHRLGHGVPRLVVLNMSVVGMVGAVGDPPSVVRHHDRRVHNVADKVVQGLVRRERLVATVVAHDKERPEHSPLRKPVQRPHQRVVDRECSKRQGRHHGHVQRQVRKRLERRAFKALLRNGITKILKRERRGVRQLAATLIHRPLPLRNLHRCSNMHPRRQPRRQPRRPRRERLALGFH